MNIKTLVKEIARLEKSADVVKLKDLKDDLKALKKTPSDKLKDLIILDNEFKLQWSNSRKPRIITDLIVTDESKKMRGKINIDGVKWSWSAGKREPNSAVQKVISVSPII
jgi:hypothetical protein